MTLTHLLPTLRRTLPDPLAVDRWPAHTSATTSDVIVAGISLVRLVEWCSTPCVHTAAAVIPGTHGRPSDSATTTVLLTRITSVGRSLAGEPVLSVDARLDACVPVLGELRLVGRVSTAHDRAYQLGGIGAAVLPADLREGDLLVMPCAAGACLHDVRGLVDPDGDTREVPVWNRCAR